MRLDAIAHFEERQADANLSRGARGR